MSEELLKAIIQLFAIVARERITDDERNNIKEFLAQHLNRDTIKYYLELFDSYATKQEVYQPPQELNSLDPDTQEFVGDWARIMGIAKQVNQALTQQQKLVLIVKIIELVFADNNLSERQNNLIFYIAQALKIPQRDLRLLQKFVTGQDQEELEDRSILIMDEGSESESYHGPHIEAKKLTGLIAILRLADSEVYFIKYLGISTLYLNGFPLRSRTIDVFPTGSTIRGNKIEPVYYSDVVSKFLTDANKTAITFSADHIFYHFKSGRAALQNINLSEKGGRLIGIMGASGSGKSTLLSVLNGSEKPSSGTIMVNGVNIYESPEEMEGVIGYIPQDDLLIEELTVFQNLFFAARLCFGDYSNEHLEALVERILRNLGITEIRDLKVGSPLSKTISGGQRKRVNIGLELLREPTILFVDEPTSGLSSRDSENIMDLLKELALRGKMIFVVIHQPSSDIFKMFDSLLILDVGGFQIYYGNPVEAVTYFKDIINAANRNQGACPECGNINPEQIFSIIETRIVNEYGRLTESRKISPGQWYQYFKQKIRTPRITHELEPIPSAQKIPNRVKQFTTFITRDILSKVANKQYLNINLLEAPILAFFISFMVKYYNVLDGGESSYSFYENQNIPVYFFMCVVVALFFGLTLSAEEIYRDRKILKREKFLHLSRNSYLLSKVIVLFVISAIQTITFTIIGNLVLEIPITEIRYWMILFSCACFANLLGLNISSAFNSAVTIYILIPLLIIPQLLLSGVVINFDKFNPRVGSPVGIPWMGEIMASRWAFEAYMVTQFKDNPFEKIFYEYDKKIAISDYKRIYFIPELESELTYCLHERTNWRRPAYEPLVRSINLIHDEISSELNLIGRENFPMVENLTIKKFDSTVYLSTRRFLSILKQFYLKRSIEATQSKDSIIQQLTNSTEKLTEFDNDRKRFVNMAISDAVKNISATNRIVAYDGKLVQRIYPIYLDEHKPKHFLDFSANLYQPTKHFLGFDFDTLYFNVSVIWTMTFILYITLYFEWLHKIVQAFESKRKYRKRNK